MAAWRGCGCSGSLTQEGLRRVETALGRQRMMSSMTDIVGGRWDTRFDKVAEALAEEIISGEELGASIAVDIDGELVADIGAGSLIARKAFPGKRTRSSTSGRAPKL